jgi:hypothetical protein
MTPVEIREHVARLNTDSTRDGEEASLALKPLGGAVVPYLSEAYPQFKKWQGRVSLVFHSIRFARVSEDAFQLGISALADKSTMVRYRACCLLAYSLRRDALPHLQVATRHSDKKTAEDAAAAIDAIKSKNHHFFIDRNHSGDSHWIVNDGDRES